MADAAIKISMTVPRWCLAQSLTDTLRRAERDGLVVRHLDPGRVETATLYQLTELGRSLDEPLSALERWVDRNWARVEAARRRWSSAQRLVPRSVSSVHGRYRRAPRGNPRAR